jgi:hypothetical protein
MNQLEELRVECLRLAKIVNPNKNLESKIKSMRKIEKIQEKINVFKLIIESNEF